MVKRDEYSPPLPRLARLRRAVAHQGLFQEVHGYLLERGGICPIHCRLLYLQSGIWHVQSHIISLLTVKVSCLVAPV